MLYGTLRAVADVALHWYYRDIVVQGRERIPAHGPLIVIANHPNALVDALVVGTTVRRRLLLTAKATLFENPLLAGLLRAVGVVPLRRAKDELDVAAGASVSRNTAALRVVTQALDRQGAVLVFPEGISHDEPSLAPLKTGAARMALAASADGVRGLHLLPLGLIYEQKERPRSRVLVRLGEPLDLDALIASDSVPDAARLTAEIDAAMRLVTLNFASDARARQAIALARVLTSIEQEPLSIGRSRPLSAEAEIARRVETATDALASASPDIVRQADALIARVEALEARLVERHATLADVHIAPHVSHGVRFVVRESTLTAVALPIALLGRVTHWIPLRLARSLALRTTTDPSRDQPAMRTIALGFAFLLFWYALLGILFTRWFGGVAVVPLLAAIFLSAHVDYLLLDRVQRGWERARTYLALRADPVFRECSLTEIELLVTDALALEKALVAPAVLAAN